MTCNITCRVFEKKVHQLIVSFGRTSSQARRVPRRAQRRDKQFSAQSNPISLWLSLFRSKTIFTHYKYKVNIIFKGIQPMRVLGSYYSLKAQDFINFLVKNRCKMRVCFVKLSLMFSMFLFVMTFFISMEQFFPRVLTDMVF